MDQEVDQQQDLEQHKGVEQHQNIEQLQKDRHRSKRYRRHLHHVLQRQAKVVPLGRLGDLLRDQRLDQHQRTMG